MPERNIATKRSIPVRFCLLLTAFCVLTFRYFFSIFYNIVKFSCMQIQVLPDGSFVTVFQQELLRNALLPYLPAMTLHLLITVSVIFVCITARYGKLSGSRGIIFCVVIGTLTVAEGVSIWLSEHSEFNQLQLACYMEAKYYSPFGLLGENGISLTFLTQSNAYLAVKYIFLAVILVLTLVQGGLFWRVSHKKNIY